MDCNRAGEDQYGDTDDCNNDVRAFAFDGVGGEVGDPDADQQDDHADDDVAAEFHEGAEQTREFEESEDVGRRNRRHEDDRQECEFSDDDGRQAGFLFILRGKAQFRDELVEAEVLEHLRDESGDKAAGKEGDEDQECRAENVAGRVQELVEEAGNRVGKRVDLQRGERGDQYRNRNEDVCDDADHGREALVAEELRDTGFFSERIDAGYDDESRHSLADDFRREQTDEENRRRRDQIRDVAENLGEHLLNRFRDALDFQDVEDRGQEEEQDHPVEDGGDGCAERRFVLFFIGELGEAFIEADHLQEHVRAVAEHGCDNPGDEGESDGSDDFRRIRGQRCDELLNRFRSLGQIQGCQTAENREQQNQIVNEASDEFRRGLFFQFASLREAAVEFLINADSVDQFCDLA